LQHIIAFEPPPQSCSGGAGELRAAAAHTITAASALGVWAAAAKNAAESLAAVIRHSTSLPGEEDVKHAAASCERLAKVFSAASEAGLELSAQADKAMNRAIKLDLANHGTGSASLATQLRSLATALDSSSAVQPHKPSTQNRGRGKAAPTKSAATSQAASSSQQHKVSQKQPLIQSQKAPLPVQDAVTDADEQPRKRWKSRFIPASFFKSKPKATVKTTPKNSRAGCAKAERLASEILERGGRVCDKDVVSILELWKFRRNTKRSNVLPVGKQFVYSEMLGLTKIRMYNSFVVAANTRKFPLVTKLLCKFLDDNPPKGLEVGTRFPFTTVCINKDYAAKRHRDNNNIGMTVFRGLGDYTGGQVKHWPWDPGRQQLPDVNDLALEEARVLDTKRRTVCVDSTKAHEVMPFSGKRYSLVYFTITRCDKTPTDVKKFLCDKCDLSIPDPEQAEDLWQRAKDSAPAGALPPTPEIESESVIVVEDCSEDQIQSDRPRSKLWASKSINIE